MTIFTNEPTSSFQSFHVYRENVEIKANDFPQPGDDYRMIHIQAGATNLTLCITRPLDVFEIPVRLTEFPFGEWTPREESPTTIGEWEPTNDYL